MNKVIYLVNGISKTSVPWRWADFFNTHSVKYKIILLNVKKILKIDKSTKIVHGHHIKAMFAFLVINFLFNKKNVYTVHGSYLFLSDTNQKLLKYIFQKTNHVIFVNKKLYDVLPEEMKKIIVDKYSIVLNGVEVGYRYKESDVYKKFKIDENDTILFHPARFVKEKNHIRILTTLKFLIEKNNKIKLVLAGDGALRDEIETHILKLGLSDNVIMLGIIERDEVYNFLKKCDLFLMPSVSEGLNIAFLEAISMHARVLVSDIEQFVYPVKAYDLNPDDLNIAFADPLDEKDIANKIEVLLAKEKNHDYDCADFSLETMMKKYEEIYDELLR